MEISSEKIREYTKRLLMSRTRLICQHPFYGLLLMHLDYSIDMECMTAYTNGEKIAFSPEFMDTLSDSELDFVMMHEILHVVLLHCFRGELLDQERFNIACDIVVNSNIMKSNNGDIKSICVSGSPSMYIAPDGKEGYHYTAEQVYEMLPSSVEKRELPSKSGGKGKSDKNGKREGERGSVTGRAEKEELAEAVCSGKWDDHTHWGSVDNDSQLRDAWLKRLSDAARVITVNDPSNTRGNLPACAERILKELGKAKLDWKTILNDFIQKEICDYSFSPPDRRFSDSDFFLPDFNGEIEKVENILFMVDTSGSMSDDNIKECYTEICGAMVQFDGRLEGILGFFDAAVYEPTPFSEISDVTKIRPVGGGGTDFFVIFEYVMQHMADNPPASIIILTDGCAPYPPERVRGDIPVLWVINNERYTPPWGKVARI